MSLQQFNEQLNNVLCRTFNVDNLPDSFCVDKNKWSEQARFTQRLAEREAKKRLN